MPFSQRITIRSLKVEEKTAKGTHHERRATYSQAGRLGNNSTIRLVRERRVWQIPRRPRSTVDHGRSQGYPGTYTRAGCLSVLSRKGVSRWWYWIILRRKHMVLPRLASTGWVHAARDVSLHRRRSVDLAPLFRRYSIVLVASSLRYITRWCLFHLIVADRQRLLWVARRRWWYVVFGHWPRV